MTVDEVLAELEALATPQTKKTLLRHGATEPIFGVRIGDMKPLIRKLGKSRQWALDLYATGNSDAMYLAGLIADETAMTKKDLQTWVERAPWHMISECTVAQLTAETPHARDLALKWIRSKKESIAAAGWSTLACWVSVVDNAELDPNELTSLITEVEKTIHQQTGRIQYAMNGFLMSLGCYVPKLTARVRKAAKAIGPLEIDMGDTACQVPSIEEMIRKVEARGAIGKKRKHARC